MFFFDTLTTKMELKELTKKTLKIFDVENVEKLGEKLINASTEQMDAFCNAIDSDLSVDWLQMIYQYYQADRKDKKQDYTPKCLAQFINRLIGGSSETIDLCAGSGALCIQRWNENLDTAFTLYEIDENVIPYLIFNMRVRNITATVHRSDVLKQEIFESWKISKGAKYGNIVNIKSAV